NGQPNAMLYDPPGVGGTTVVTVLAHGDHPEWYGLPANPTIPASVWMTKTLLKPVGLLAIAGSVGAMPGHFLRYGPKEPAEGRPTATAPEDPVVGDHIVRHRLSTRVVHWSTAILFFALLLSGMPIWSPIFGWMANVFGGLAVCRWLHPWLGLGFFVATIAMFAMWLKDMRMEKDDWKWVGPKALDLVSHKLEDPDVGKYNGGQKVFFYLVALLGVLLLVTGVVLWFPRELPDPLPGLSWVVHDAGFLLFAVAI